MHIVTLSFDDSFRESFLKAAGIYEKYGLCACFNVLAGTDTDDFVPVEYLDGDLGDFGLWRELAARGHEIMPHGWVHENLSMIPFERATSLVLKSLDRFETELPGFRRKDAVFNFPYNASTGQLEAWLPTVVRAFRTWGERINPLPSPETVKLECMATGPENCQQHLDTWIEKLLLRPSGWLIYNTHGLDGEGWGPIGSVYLDRLLDRLAKVESVQIMPAAAALRAGGPAPVA